MDKRNKLIIGILLTALIIIIGARIIENRLISTAENKNVMDEQEMIMLGNGLYEKVYGLYWEEDGEYLSIDYNEVDGDYCLVNLDMSKIKGVMSEKLTTEYFNQRNIIKKDDKYYILNVLPASDITYLGKDGLEIKNVTEDRIDFIVNEKYAFDSENDAEFRIEKNDFSIIKEDGTWKVDKFILSDN